MAPDKARGDSRSPRRWRAGRSGLGKEGGLAAGLDWPKAGNGPASHPSNLSSTNGRRGRRCRSKAQGNVRWLAAVPMKSASIALTAAATILCSCASTPFVGDLSPQAARRQAQRDFTAGAPKIYAAGGFAVFEPGIADKDKTLVAKLPRNGRFAGCTNPKVRYSVGYATAYNQEIISLLRRGHAR